MDPGRSACYDYGQDDALRRMVAFSQPDKLLNNAWGNLLQAAENTRLRNAIKQMYRPNARVSNGSTADVIRHELRTGELLSPKGHFQKGVDIRTSLTRILQRGNLCASDRQIANELLVDLQNALSGQ